MTTSMQQQAVEHLLSVRDWIRYGVTRLEQSQVVYGQGTDNAWDEAVFLVLRTLSLPVDQLDPFLDARVLPEERNKLFTVFEKRCTERVPAAYILGESWLAGLRFEVTPDVLIPRSPISELIGSQFSPWIDADRVQTIADVCTGSGCLAILAALNFPCAKVYATDISKAALSVATRNVSHYGLESQVELLQTNLIEALPEDNSCDLIICNPPYVNSTSMAALPKEFLHEPQLALAGGNDGMNLIRELFDQVKTRLHPDGWLILEIGHEIDNFLAAFPDLNPVWLSTAAAEDQIMLLNASELTT